MFGVLVMLFDVISMASVSKISCPGLSMTEFVEHLSV